MGLQPACIELCARVGVGIGVGVGVGAEAADRVSLVGAAHGMVLREKRHVVRDHLAVVVVAVGGVVAVRVGKGMQGRRQTA